MTDSTAHNIGVMDFVCNEPNVENIPQQPFCNVHPLIMFQNKGIVSKDKSQSWKTKNQKMFLR